MFGDLGEGSKKQEFALDLMKGEEGVILCLDVLIFLSGTQYEPTRFLSWQKRRSYRY